MIKEDVTKADKKIQLEFIKKTPRTEVEEAYRPLARSVADKYVKGTNAEWMTNTLIDTALGELSRARRNFLKRSEKKLEFKFSTYLAYYFKEAIEARLKEERKKRKKCQRK